MPDMKPAPAVPDYRRGRMILFLLGAAAATGLMATEGCNSPEADQGTPPQFIEATHLNAFETGFGYSQVVKVGKTLYVSGTFPVDAQGQLVAPGDMGGQLRAVYTNLQAALAAHGAGLDRVTMERITTTDMEAFLKVADLRMEFHPKEALPAASFMEVRRLVDPGFLVQVEAVAELP